MASVTIFVILHGNNRIPWWWELPNQLPNLEIDFGKRKRYLFVVIQRKVKCFLHSGFLTISILAIFTPTSFHFFLALWTIMQSTHAIIQMSCVCPNWVITYAMFVTSRSAENSLFKKKASFTTKFATESYPNGFCSKTDHQRRASFAAKPNLC